MTKPALSRVEASIDWLSVSMALGSPTLADWTARCKNALQLVADAGNIVRAGRSLGYEGVQAGGSFFGERADGSYLRLTGAWAGKLFYEVFDINCHTSRLDMQVTVQFREPQERIGNKSYKEAVTANELLKGPRRRKIHKVVNADGGFSLYIGARTSESYGNLYNKEAESGDPHYERCWRYEVRATNDTATRTALVLYQAQQRVPALIASTVWRWYYNRGVLPPWTVDDEDNALSPASKPQTDTETSLRWLATQVRPTVRRLVALGYAASVYDALGITLDASDSD